jgi:hypothetical protein
MVANIRFEVELGLLKIKQERETDNINIGFEFESFADGKLYLLDMDQAALEGHHKVFAFDATIVIDITSEKPTDVKILKVPTFEHTIARVIYNTDVKGRPQEITFDLPEKQYPEGSSAKVIDLERQMRIDRLAHEKLQAEHEKLQDRYVKLQKSFDKWVDLMDNHTEECVNRFINNDNRQIIQVPFTKLVVSKDMAHEYMKKEGSYAWFSYMRHIESKKSMPIDWVVDSFLDDGHKRLMFNMHYLNHVEGIDFIAPAGMHFGVKRVIEHEGKLYNICDKTGWEIE